MEREERWIATVREKLRGADESLPEGGWEALERDLAAAGRRRRAFTPAWKKIAAVAAVVAIAVLIGETVVNQGVVDVIDKQRSLPENLRRRTVSFYMMTNRCGTRRRRHSPKPRRRWQRRFGRLWPKVGRLRSLRPTGRYGLSRAMR